MRFLQGTSVGNLEIRRHNILSDELENDAYDVVHCRCLLIHLPEPEKALKRMADAVRPSGWLVIEDLDCGSCLSVDVTDSSAAPLASAYRAGLGPLKKRGVMDPYFGRRLRSLVEGLGYEDMGQEGFTYMLRGGDPMADMYATSWQAIVKPLVAVGGVITEEQYDTVMRLLRDLGFSYPGRTLFSAWGRKPC